MQIFDQSVEEKCIKTLTDPTIPEKHRSTLLGNLNKDFFHYPPCLAAYQRIDIIAKKRFTLTDLDELLSDPALSEEFRDMLRESDAAPAKNKTKLKHMVESLDNWRKIRIVYSLANEALDQVEADDVDVDKLLDKIGTKLLSAQHNVGVEDEFVHFGKNSNAADVIHDSIHRVMEELYKTGFTEYDERNGGLPKEGVMIMGATTSGGKSTVLMNLLINMYLINNVSVTRISLEMGNRQETQRMGSRLSKVPFYKIKQSKMSPVEKQRFMKAFKEFEAHGAANDCTFSTISPTKGMTIDDVLRAVKPFAPKVIALDYVSLLDGVDEDNQWRVLSAIIRKCKVYSRETSCLIIILCQIDSETSKIRYSQGMKEHADVVWLWNYFKKEQRELRILPIDVAKARDGELMNFNLAERFDIMTVENMSGGGDFSDTGNSSRDVSTDEDDDEIPKKKKKGNKKLEKLSGKKGKKKSKLDDEDDDDSKTEFVLS